MTTRICLVGTGFIAGTHAEVIRGQPGLSLAAVVDTETIKARQFAAQWGAKQTYSDIGEALEQRMFDRVHVLVPPPVHDAAALPFLAASLPTLVEKPLASSTLQSQHMVDAAARTGTRLGVNQNFLFHPAFAGLLKRLSDGEIGTLDYVDCLYSMPLRQLQARQFGHWMFAEPKNILLEQAVHPLSQIMALAGAAERFEVVAGPSREISPGVKFYPSCDVTLDCEQAPAHLRFAVGAEYPSWQIMALGSDGSIIADMIRNRVLVSGRSRWLEAIDDLLSGFRSAGQTVYQSTANSVTYGLSIAGLSQRSDPFFQSMKASIEAFHTACDTDRIYQADANFGLKLVSLCEQISERGFEPQQETRPKPRPRKRNANDIVLLGGTGFIGRAVLKRLLKQKPSPRIAVMARNLANLPEGFHHEQVELIAGDVTCEADVANAIDSAPVVVNLAHGGAGDTWSEIERRMVGSARTIASTCLDQGTRSLIHVGSIAALYLGDASEVIIGETHPDSRAHRRGDYARAKAVADRLLINLHHEKGLPVCILRPGVVVGEGTSPFHSGLGFFNNEQHCLGWNQGRNPLPFVLVDDVADAIVRAAGSSDLSGLAFNLVGDVKLTAREYIEELADALARPLRFHGQSPAKLYMVEAGKWSIKRLSGRQVAPPSFRDLRSRGLFAAFDCSDVKRALNWTPVSDREVFVDRAIRAQSADAG